MDSESSSPQVEILCGATGSGKTTEALRRYADQVGRGGEDTALLILPTARVIRQARAWLVTEGGLPGLVDPRLFTFPGLAAILLNANHECATPIGPAAQELLLREVIRGLATDGQLAALGEVSALPGFVRAALDLIADLKRAAVQPKRFCAALAEAGLSQPWHGEIGGLYCAYQWLLLCLRTFDVEGRFWWAREVLSRGDRRPLTRVELMVVDGFTDLTTTQLDVLRLLAEGIPKTLVTLGYTPDDPREALVAWHQDTLDRLRGALPGATETAWLGEPGSGPLAHLRAHLFSPPDPRRALPAEGRIHLLECPNRSREIREALRQTKKLLVEGRARPGEIALILRSPADYAEAVHHIASRLGVPVHLETPASPLASHAVQAVLHAYETVVSGYRRDDVVALLRSNYLALVPASAEDVALAGCEAKVMEGREQWGERLAACRRRLERRTASRPEALPAETEDETPAPGSPAAKLAAVRAAQQALPALLDLLPDPGSNLDLPARVAETRAFLLRARVAENTARPEIAEQASVDLRALEAFEQGLDELEHAPTGAVPPGGLTLSAYLALLRNLLATATASPGLPAGDRVSVIDPRAARQLRFRHCFVAGLIEGEFPRRPSEEPFFSRQELARLESCGVALERRRTPEAEEPLLFHAALAAATEELWLSYPATDAEGKVLRASHYLGEVRQLFSDGLDERRVALSEVAPSLEAPAGPAEVIERAFFDLAAPASPGGATAYHAALKLPGGPEIVRRAMAGIQLEDLRGRPDVEHRHAGVLHDPALVADLARRFGADHRFSGTALSAYAGCPFAFFCNYVLGLTVLEPPELLDARQAGEVRHRILRDFARARREHRPDSPLILPGEEDVAAEELRTLAAAEFARFAEREGVAEPVLWAIERDQAQADLTRWARREAEVFGGQAFVDCEVNFGNEAPAPLPGHPDLLLTGRIDRVNRVESGAGPVFVLLDYKRRGLPQAKRIQDGLELQFPLYAVGAPQALPALANVPCGSWHYWSLSGELKLAPAAKKPLGAEKVQEVLDHVLPSVAELVSALREGWFSHEAAECSTFCAFRDVCRRNPWKIAKESADAESTEDGA